MRQKRIALVTAAIGAGLLATPAPADVKAGVDAWTRGDYAAAIKEWRQPAINGDADAQFNLGQAYKLGRGVPADPRLAEDWYRKAAAQGHLQAEDNYALVLFQNGDRQRALPLIEKSAMRGEPRAQYVYGTALFNGDMVKKDWPRAYALMTRASASGLAPASASLAQMDRYVPVEQRQKGLAMARDLEREAQRPMIAQATPAPVRPAPAPVKTAAIPPSQPATAAKPVEKPAKPPVAVAKAPPAPKPVEKPVQTAAAPKPPVAKAAAPAVTASPAKPAPVAPATGKTWRVQLGAFSEQGKAKTLWSSLERGNAQLASLQPYLVQAGAVTRLQAGPLGSKAAADKLCGSLKAGGQPCLTVAP